MNMKLIAVLGLSFLAVGCGKANLEGTYQGSNNVTLTSQGSTNSGGTNGMLQTVSLTLRDIGSNTLTGDLTTTSQNSISYNGIPPFSGQVAGTSNGDTLNVTNLTATGVTSQGGTQYQATLSGQLKSNPDGTILTGSLSGPCYTNMGPCYNGNTVTFQLNLTKTGQK